MVGITPQELPERARRQDPELLRAGVALVDNDLPGLDIWPAFLLSLVVVGVGIWVYNRLQRHFADVL